MVTILFGYDRLSFCTVEQLSDQLATCVVGRLHCRIATSNRHWPEIACNDLIALLVVLCFLVVVTFPLGQDRLAVGTIERLSDQLAAWIVSPSQCRITSSNEHQSAVLAKIGLKGLVALLIILCLPAVVTILLG